MRCGTLAIMPADLGAVGQDVGLADAGRGRGRGGCPRCLGLVPIVGLDLGDLELGHHFTSSDGAGRARSRW